MERHLLVRSLLKLLKLVAINLVLLFALLELVSLGFYLLQTGNFFYPRDKDLILANTTQFKLTEPDREAWMSHYQLHPYFGFMHPPNYASLPLKKTSKDQFIVGIFGGSVAQRLCDYEFQHHVLASRSV